MALRGSLISSATVCLGPDTLRKHKGYPRRRLGKVGIIRPDNRIGKLRVAQVFGSNASQEARRRMQLRVRTRHRRQQTHGPPKFLGNEPDVLHQIAFIGKHGRDAVPVLEGVKQQVARQIDVAAFLLGLVDLHHLRQWLGQLFSSPTAGSGKLLLAEVLAPLTEKYHALVLINARQQHR